MGKASKIEWCDATWNPWQGCRKVSTGCAHCYMYREKRMYGQDPATIVRSKPATFNAPLTWKEPKRIFVCSWSDFFIEEADPWRAEAWEIMRRTPWQTYLIPSKRTERHRDCVPWAFHREPMLPNVWLGLSVSIQEDLDKAGGFRDHMVGAAVHFLSIEPLLGPFANLDDEFQEVDLGDEEHSAWIPPVDWVIVGGESGGSAERSLAEHRMCGLPKHGHWYPKEEALEWVRSIRDQCVAAEVPFFMKQWGGPRPNSGGRLLDGRTWDEFPQSAERMGSAPDGVPPQRAQREGAR
jgi:protein gp37